MADPKYPRIVTFYGASDDCIEIEGCPGADEFYVNGRDFGMFDLIVPGDTLRVKVAYEPHGCWSVAVMPHEEDADTPLWPIELVDSPNGYSAHLAVHCPDEVTLRRVDDDG